jgi:hypothetical protein
MKCKEAMDAAYEYSGEYIPSFGLRFSMALHVLFCGRCASEMRLLQAARFSLQHDFFPVSPDFVDAILDRVNAVEDEDIPLVSMPGGVPVRGWVIVGCVVLLSLATSFFNRDFISVAGSQGSSYLLPLGIIIGIVITAYGAIFIGSHLKEFSERFGLH